MYCISEYPRQRAKDNLLWNWSCGTEKAKKKNGVNLKEVFKKTFFDKIFYLIIIAIDSFKEQIRGDRSYLWKNCLFPRKSIGFFWGNGQTRTGNVRRNDFGRESSVLLRATSITTMNLATNSFYTFVEGVFSLILNF